jgi:hypothetical protein
MRARLWLVATMTLVAAGCGSDGTTDPTPTTAPAVPTTITPTTTTVPPVAALNLTLLPDGLGSLRFGDPTDEVVGALTAAYGPVLERGNIACDSGSNEYVNFGGLSTIHDDGSWAGWSYGTGREEPVADLATAEGITLGSTLADLQAAYGADLNVLEEALGPEFFVGADYPGLGGFLTGTDDADTVTILYAGDLCAFR